MIKFAHVFLLLAMLVAAAQCDDPCCSDIENSQADFKSDVKALQDLVQDTRTRLEGVENVKPLTVQQRKVAFFVGLNKFIGPFTQNTNIVFDNVVTNIGSAYSVSTGRFTAPVTATYQFGISIAAQSGQRAGVYVMKNEARIMTVWSDYTPQWTQSFKEAILSLKAGDQVWLQLLAEASSVYGKMYNTFSGYLIFEN